MNIFRQSVALLFLLLFSKSAFGQEWTTFLPKTGKPVIEAMPDGNLFVAESRGSVDTLTVYKITPAGQILWESDIKSGGSPTPGGSRRNGCVGIFPDANGSVKLVTHSATVNAGITFSQLDGAGNEMWRFDTISAGSGWTLDAVRDANGDFVLTRNYGLGITKYDANGHFKFSKIPPGGGGNWTESICKTDDGGYLIAADWFYIGSKSYNVFHLNSLGDTLGYYKMPCNSNDNLVCKGADGAYCMAGYTSSTICWKVFHLDGTVVFENSLPATGVAFNDLVALPDGYVIGGKRNNVATIWRLNLNGDLISERSFFPGENSVFRGLASVPGSQLVYATGTTEPSLGNTQVFAMCIDATWPENIGLLTGKVRKDDDADCATDPNDAPFVGVPVVATAPGYTFYTLSDANGNYRFWLEAGDWQVEAINNHPYWAACAAPQTVAVFQDDTVSANFWLKKLHDCPLMQVSISNYSMIRCLDVFYAVRFCNLGNTTVDDPQITVVLDPNLNFISADIPPSLVTGDSIVFDLANIPPDSCGVFLIKVGMDCPETQIGQTLCTSAHITPNSICGNFSNWSGASMAVGAECDGDSVRLFVTNRGSATTSELMDYVITEDDVILMRDSIVFPPGLTNLVAFAANGSTWRIESEQEPGHPGFSMPSAALEGCGENGTGSFSMGFINMFPPDDDDFADDINCTTVVGSCDPNDKEGFPKGFGAKKYIERGIDLDYLIRFQNTGTAPAFTVVLRDTLPESLNPASIEIGAASHPFSWFLEGRGVLVVRFDNILLPDSTANEPESHGWINFRIAQKPDLPDGTEIENRVGIYFDFNDPVMTNFTFHTIGKDFIPVVSIQEIDKKSLGIVRIFPNPAQAGSWLVFEKETFNGLTFRLFDVFGREIFTEKIEARRVFLPSKMGEGMFVFRVEKSGGIVGSGKLVAKAP